MTLSHDFLFFTMTQDFYNFLFHGVVIISLLKVSNIARLSSRNYLIAFLVILSEAKNLLHSPEWRLEILRRQNPFGLLRIILLNIL